MPGLTMLWLAPAQDWPEVAHARRYVVEKTSSRLLWIEAPGAPPRQAGESMSFELVREAGRVPELATPWLYLVHTDIPEEVVEDYNAWYDREHLPRLVSVPGVVRA